jgi:hypothetical protein
MDRPQILHPKLCRYTFRCRHTRNGPKSSTVVHKLPKLLTWPRTTVSCTESTASKAVTYFSAMKTRFTGKQGLHEAERKAAGRGRHATLFSGHAADGTPDVVTLEANGFIERVPGRGRSIRLRVPREQLPDLE